jgi:hypothetical protein
MTIQLDTLPNCPHLLTQVAEALWSEFKTTYLSYFPFRSPDDIEAYLRSMHMTPHSEPLSSLVVHNGAGTLIGFCNIMPDDLGSPWNQCVTLSPWLANVYVAHPYRSQGIGDIMLTYMRKNVVPTYERPVYLWTHTPQLRDWYGKRHKFTHVQTLERYADHPEIYIMKSECSRPTS